MKTTKFELNLTLTQLEQLALYVRDTQESGHYYGNKSQWEKRHEAIVDEFERLPIRFHIREF